MFEECVNLILSIVIASNCKKYLELGIWKGQTISKISESCDYCVGVDKNDSRNYFNFNFTNTTIEEFFIKNKETFDIIFIDANHEFNETKNYFNGAIKILNENGIIFIHDTDPKEEYLLSHRQCHDSYKIPQWLNENYTDLNVITLPIREHGMTIVNRKIDRRVDKLIK